MLRKTRIALACIFLLGITLLFAGIGAHWWGWMAKLQFLPSMIALNFAVLAGILVFTFVFGRLYCSVICPLGVFQDLALRIRQAVSKKLPGRPVKKFSYSPEHKWIRREVLLVFAALLFFTDSQVIIALIAPYSAYGRMVRSIIGLGTGNATLALTAVGLVTLVVIVTLSVLYGRIWCNTICPVGTVLSWFSRFALFQPTIDKSKCVGCHACEKKCKASCINSAEQKIDLNRCIDCFDCIESCKTGAISYRFAYGRKEKAVEAAEPDKGRRNFIVTGAALIGGATVAKAQEKKVDGGLADVMPKTAVERETRLVPPGAGSVKNFYDHCTACQLCVSACPNKVLRPSTDLGHLLQPQMGYENGFCRPECVECSNVCPAGAIRPVSRDEKTMIHIGLACVDSELCTACGKCRAICPTGAIMLVKDEASGKRIAAVAEEQCIGCGKCEFLCPVRPVSAIKVNGLTEHRNG